MLVHEEPLRIQTFPDPLKGSQVIAQFVSDKDGNPRQIWGVLSPAQLNVRESARQALVNLQSGSRLYKGRIVSKHQTLNLFKSHVTCLNISLLYR